MESQRRLTARSSARVIVAVAEFLDCRTSPRRLRIAGIHRRTTHGASSGGMSLGRVSIAQRTGAVVTALWMTGQTVVGHGLPGGGVGDESADAGPDPGIAVEGAHADTDGVGVAEVAT